MSRNRKSETARRNGAKSQGPITEEGKRVSSRNALKHGIHSTQTVLPHEDQDAYDRLLAAFVDEWQPATPTEEALVLDMVSARWRLQRIELLVAATIEYETETLQDQLDRREETMTTEGMFARVHIRNAVHNANTLETFERWESRLHRSFQRALKTLRSLQTERKANVGEAVSTAASLQQPVEEQAQFENRRNEPTGEQPEAEQPLTHRSLEQPDVENGHKPLPLTPFIPDVAPPDVQ